MNLCFPLDKHGSLGVTACFPVENPLAAALDGVVQPGSLERSDARRFRTPGRHLRRNRSQGYAHGMLVISFGDFLVAAAAGFVTNILDFGAHVAVRTSIGQARIFDGDGTGWTVRTGSSSLVPEDEETQTQTGEDAGNDHEPEFPARSERATQSR
jgi:hypothetical protein